MRFMRWLGAILLLFWLLGLVFRLGGLLVNILLLIAALTFIFDMAKDIKKGL